MGERSVRNAEVEGSIPFRSIRKPFRNKNLEKKEVLKELKEVSDLSEN